MRGTANFKVTVTKKIETTVFVKAADEAEAKALAWTYLPSRVDYWHCEFHDGTKYKVEQVEHTLED